MGFVRTQEPVINFSDGKSGSKSLSQKFLLKLKDLKNESPERLRNLRAILSRLSEDENLSDSEKRAIQLSQERIDKAERYLERRGKWRLGPSLIELQDERASKWPWIAIPQQEKRIQAFLRAEGELEEIRKQIKATRKLRTLLRKEAFRDILEVKVRWGGDGVELQILGEQYKLPELFEIEEGRELFSSLTLETVKKLLQAKMMGELVSKYFPRLKL